MSDSSSPVSAIFPKNLRKLPSHWFTSAFLIELVFRLMLGAYFVYYALGKLGDPNFFALQISNYKMLPDPFNSILGLTLPWLELFAGLGLIVRQLYLGSLVAINGMLVMFIIAISTALLRGLDISCGCTNTGGGDNGLVFRLLVDLVALAVGVVLLAWATKVPPTPKPES